jgi:hypothetical protein
VMILSANESLGVTRCVALIVSRRMAVARKVDSVGSVLRRVGWVVRMSEVHEPVGSIIRGFASWKRPSLNSTRLNIRSF